MKLFSKKTIILLSTLSLIFGLAACSSEDDSNDSNDSVDLDALYQSAVVDSMVAEQSEIEPLVSIIPQDPMTTWDNEGRVLMVTWSSYPDSYPTGDDVTLSYGSVWTFTDLEILAWYRDNQESIQDPQVRFNQLIGLPPSDSKTHFTAFWVDPDDVTRPAYITDATIDEMTTNYSDDIDEEYRTWFDQNVLDSYYGDYLYPWTRMGYTYDWADNGTEYGLSEFIVAQNSEVTVEFTLTTDEFLDYMDEQIN